MKRNTWANTLAAVMMMATLLASPAQAHGKHAAEPEKAEWLQRPLDQAQANPQDQVVFAPIQSECMQTSATPFGPQADWKACQLVNSGFVATIGLQDFYYADYCLVKTGNACAQQAQVMFRNRAYRPEAFLDLARIDPPGTTYESPLLIGGQDENVLSTAVLLPGKSQLQRRYFRYEGERWIPIDGKAWLQELRKQLPHGLSTRVSPKDALPDPRTMMLRLPLYRGVARAGSVDVRLAVASGQMEMAEFKLIRSAK